jgi:hypothetical protein
MVQGVFQLVAAAADVFFAGIEGKLVIGLDGIAGFAGGLGVDADLSGKNGAFGAFAAFTKAAFNQSLVEASHVEMSLSCLMRNISNFVRQTEARPVRRHPPNVISPGPVLLGWFHIP